MIVPPGHSRERETNLGLHASGWPKSLPMRPWLLRSCRDTVDAADHRVVVFVG
jgi:hypothetical protein